LVNKYKKVAMNKIELAKEVVKIARKAGEAILEIYENARDLEIERKADNSPLTLADKSANEIICTSLEKLPVQFPIVSEENKEIPYATRKTFEYNWLVDPLDGTKEFIKRNGEFTVNIALIHRNRVVLGVVYTPVTDEIFWAVKGKGAFHYIGETEKNLQAASFQLTDPHLNIVCSRSHLNGETKDFIAQFRQPNMVSKGSSLKFLILAKGEAHLYPRLAPTMEWDTAAAQIILEEAGGKVIDEQTEKPLLYNRENLRNPSFIAFGKVNNLMPT